MPKYRQLSQDELVALKPDFIDFLVVNGIDAEEWTKMQSKQPAKADEIIELFSDVVFEKILRRASYLKHLTNDSLHCFHYQSNQAVMIALKSTTGQFSLTADITSLLKTGEYELVTGQKTHVEQRELEMFRMIRKGAEISEGEWYKELAMLL